MTTERKAQIVTIAVLLAAVGVGVARKSGWRLPAQSLTSSSPTTEQSPQDAIYAMLSAAQAGDVRGYLARYAGSMESGLRQNLAETGEVGFSKYLKDAHAAIKGAAVSDPENIGDREAKLRVEYIYEDRNEAQTMYLEKAPDGWKISRVESGERIRTLIPYGTPVK